MFGHYREMRYICKLKAANRCADRILRQHKFNVDKWEKY